MSENQFLVNSLRLKRNMEFLPGCRVSDRFVVGVKKCTKRLNKYVELDTLKHV